VRHRALDARTQRAQRLGQIARLERSLDRHHSATDVDAHGSRDDRALRRDHRTHGRTFADVHVRHDGQVRVHERHTRDVLELRLRLLVHRYAVRPHLHVATAFDVHYFVVLFHHFFHHS